MSDSLQPQGLYSPWNSLSQNTGMGSLSLLQEIFPTQGSNLGLLHYRHPGALAQSSGREAALAWASLAQRFPASSVLALEGAGCGSVGDVPGAWLASAPRIAGGFFTS